ncbi:hypothetical protein CHS0354_038461, partial [Potamilus streckersoni]
MANQLKATFTKFRFAKKATQKDTQAKKILNQIYGNLDFTISQNKQEDLRPKTCNANLKRKDTHPAYTYIKEQTQNNNNNSNNYYNIGATMAKNVHCNNNNKRTRANESVDYIHHDQELDKQDQINTEIDQTPQQIFELSHDTTYLTQTQVKNKTSKIRYADDKEKPGPSKTHTLEELREIMAALSQDTMDTLQDSSINLSIIKKLNEPATYCGKGKQPLRGTPRQPQAKLPRTELKTQQYNSTTINDEQVTEKYRPQPKHKLQPHPRYLTLYLKSPNNTPITLSDSAIQIELMKHKSGN